MPGEHESAPDGAMQKSCWSVFRGPPQWVAPHHATEETAMITSTRTLSILLVCVVLTDCPRALPARQDAPADKAPASIVWPTKEWPAAKPADERIDPAVKMPAQREQDFA